MAEKTLTARFKQKVDTSTNWAANNPVLLVGEIGCESDTFKIKVGDGSTAWNELSYVIADVTIDTALDESSSNAIANSAATIAINENATNLSDFIDISAGRIVTDAGTGNVGEIFNDYTNNVATGHYSHAEGYGNTASGHYSHAEGYGNTAGGYSSHAEGYGNTAIDYYNHAEGYGNTTTGKYSHAEGYSNTASGRYGSHAEGYGNTASGSYGSHAEGCHTTASAKFSHAGGCYTTADQEAQTAIGKYNLTGQTDSLFAVGNGTSENSLSNAFEVFDDASVRIGNEYAISPQSETTTDDDGNETTTSWLSIAPVSESTSITIQINGGTITYDSSTDTFTI